MEGFRRYIWNIGLALLAAVGFAACDIHEFPHEEEPVAFCLNLDFTNAVDMGFNREVDYAEGSAAANGRLFAPPADAKLYVRYTVAAYAVDESGNVADHPAMRTAVTRVAGESLNSSIPLNITPGRYRFYVWTDYADGNSTADWLYDTRNLGEISYPSREAYTGSTDMRDAFRGETEAELSMSNTAATVEMKRPLAKFRFVSDDLKEFVAQALAQRNSDGRTDAPALSATEMERAIKELRLQDYRVSFRYEGYMPAVFNLFTDKPVDSWAGVEFGSRMAQIDDGDVELGFDYVMMNGKETTVPVSVSIYDAGGKLLTKSAAIDVPLKRNMLTVVRGRFLTTKTSSGVGINTDFDGEYDYEVP